MGSDPNMVVTAELLRRVWPKACSEEMKRFEQLFPDGVAVDKASFDKFDEAIMLTCVWDFAVALGVSGLSKCDNCPCEFCSRHNQIEQRDRFARLVEKVREKLITAERIAYP